MSAFIKIIEKSRKDCFNSHLSEHLYVIATWYFLLLLTITKPYLSPASLEYTFARTPSLTKQKKPVRNLVYSVLDT